MVIGCGVSGADVGHCGLEALEQVSGTGVQEQGAQTNGALGQ